MGWLERLDELDRRLGVHGPSPRPSPAVWVLIALAVAGLVGVIFASYVVDGPGGTFRAVVPGAVGVAAVWWANARGGRRRVTRVTAVVFALALLGSLPAAFMGFWQGTVLILVIGVIPLVVLTRAPRDRDA